MASEAPNTLISDWADPWFPCGDPERKFGRTPCGYCSIIRISPARASSGSQARPRAWTRVCARFWSSTRRASRSSRTRALSRSCNPRWIRVEVVGRTGSSMNYPLPFLRLRDDSDICGTGTGIIGVTGRQPLRPSRNAQYMVKIRLGHGTLLPSRTASARERIR